MKRIFRIWLPLLLSGIFISCIDDKYDLDNIDMTIGTSGDLKVPTSSTGEIILKNIMDLKEDGIVQVVDGEYFLIEDGEADVPKITIEPISIKKPVLEGFNTTVNFDELVKNQSSKTKRRSIPGFDQIPSDSYRYTIKNGQASLELTENISSGKITEDVVSIKAVRFADEIIIDAKIEIYFDSEHTFIDMVHLDGLKVTLPRGLNVTKAEYIHCTEKEGERVHAHVEKLSEEIIEEAQKSGILSLTDENDNTIIGEGHEIHVRIAFDGASIGNENSFQFDENEVKFINGSFKIDGTFRLETNDFNLEKLTDQQLENIITSGSFESIRPDFIKFNGTAEFDKDIVVKSFAGEIKSEVGEISPIVLDNLPDFLNDPAVLLDLANPAFFVAVNSELPVSAETKITLTSCYDDMPAECVETDIITIPAMPTGSTENYLVYILASKPQDVRMPKEFTKYPQKDILIENLNKLLRKLPKEIKVEVSDVVINTDNMPIPTGKAIDYNVDVKYKIYTPLEYGNEFTLVYQGTEDGLSEDLADINTLDTKEVCIDAKAVTNFPMSLKLSVDALDKNNVSMIDKIVKVVYDNDDKKKSILINAHSGKDFSVQPISLTIKPVKGHTISEMLQRLDKFHYRAVAEAVGEGKLMENVSIKLTDINITLKGGISYDAN